MRGIYLFYSDIDRNKMSGIEKKVIAQIDTFNKINLECNLVTLPYKCNSINKILSRLPFINTMPKWQYNNEFDNIDYLYFRRPPYISKATLRFLKQLRKKNKNIKILYEIPTYPYDKEMTIRKIDIPYLIKDRYNRRKIVGLVDRVVTLTNDEYIFGIPTLKITNGIDLDSVKPISSIKEPSDVIVLTAVAMFADWHGYDRLIEGIYNYYKNGGNRNIILNLIGRGAVLSNYKQLTLKYNLENNVIFHGVKSGKELDEIYRITDISIDALGMYRKNNYFSSSLKSREYLAKGLPIVIGCKLDLIENNTFKYYLEFENNSSPINIEKVTEFYDKVYLSNETRQDVIFNIRHFAEQTCSMSKAMESVISYLKD